MRFSNRIFFLVVSPMMNMNLCALPPLKKREKKNRTANKDIACLLLVSSLDAKVTTEVRAADFTERCCFKLSVLETDAFADM